MLATLVVVVHLLLVQINLIHKVATMPTAAS
jgi:hypothetical protein